MPKEPYTKPEIKSEEVLLGALAQVEIPPVVSGGNWGIYLGWLDPLLGNCCD